MEPGASHVQPSWFSPIKFTLLLCFLFFWVYVDRGTIGSTSVNGSVRSKDNPLGTGIQGDFNLSNFEDGVLSSTFMVGMLIASPIFSEAVHYMKAMRVLGIGMGVWMFGVLGTGLAPNYISMVFFRSFVGAGEAAILCLSPPFIDDHAPPRRKGIWLAALYTTIPLGIGGGYVLGGYVGASLSWRTVFYIEAAVVLPIVLFCLLAPPVDFKKGSRSLSTRLEGSAMHKFLRHTRIVLSHPVYVITVAGYTIYTGVVGLVAFWGPKCAKALFVLDDADLLMGIMSSLTGVFGTLLGGMLLDRLDCSIPQALALASIPTLGAVCCLIPAFVLATSVAWFAGPFTISAILLFSIQAPVNAVFLWIVPSDQRALASSLSVLSMHLFGDVPSPAAFGAILDAMQKIVADEAAAYKRAMVIVGAFLFVSAFLFFIAGIVSQKAVDYRKVEKSRNEYEGAQNDDESVSGMSFESQRLLADGVSQS